MRKIYKKPSMKVKEISMDYAFMENSPGSNNANPTFDVQEEDESKETEIRSKQHSSTISWED